MGTRGDAEPDGIVQAISSLFDDTGDRASTRRGIREGTSIPQITSQTTPAITPAVSELITQTAPQTASPSMGGNATQIDGERLKPNYFAFSPNNWLGIKR
jgi:hypothetical protein